jgi:predicted aspartyl protease
MKKIFVLAPLLFILLTGTWACDDDGSSFEYEGDGGVPIPINLITLTPEIQFEFMNEPGAKTFVLDTGAPLNLADVGIYSESTGAKKYDASGLGLYFPNLEVVFEDIFEDNYNIAGLIGGSLLVNFDWEINYPQSHVTLFPNGFPEIKPDELPVSFILAGGGGYAVSNGDTVFVDKTRHLVTLNIEGSEILALLDTGASYMVIKESVVNNLGWATRPDLGDTTVLTVYGPVTAPLTEMETIAFSDQENSTIVHNVRTVVIYDEFLDSLYVETGRKVDALIGGTFLMNFNIKFATAERKLYVSSPVLKTFNIENYPSYVRLPYMMK